MEINEVSVYLLQPSATGQTQFNAYKYYCNITCKSNDNLMPGEFMVEYSGTLLGP